MAEPRVRRIETPLSTQDVEEYRALIKLAQGPIPTSSDEIAKELTRLCRLRNRPALLRARLRFGRELLLVRVVDLDGDGRNEILVIDSDRNVHTPRFSVRQTESGEVASWIIGSHRYRGRLLGVSFSPFGVFHRQEAIVTSVEENDGSAVYRELKLTCDGQQWDVAELEHRSTSSQGLGEIRLIGDSSEVGRVPVLRVRPDDGRLWVEIIDDRVGPRSPIGTDFGKVSFLPGEVTDMVLADDELVVAYARGGLQRISRDGRLRSLLFPQWRFVCLAYSQVRRPADRGMPGRGLLLGGTSFGYVFAMDLSQSHSGVLWRMDAGFLFSSMTLADVESSGRTDLVLGGIDGGLRIYELTEPQLLNQRCRQLFGAMGHRASDKLLELAPPRHEAHPAVQLYLLSRVLESSGPATHAVVELVRWFTLGQPGWHTLPERAQREAVVTMEHFLLTHLPQLATIEGRSTPTGPLPLLSARQLQEGGPGDVLPAGPYDPTTKLQLARTVMAELVEIYLGAPRLVRHQIDRISRRLFEQYWQLAPTLLSEEDGLITVDQPPPELRKLLNVRSLRAREYSSTLATESETRLDHLQSLPDGERPRIDENSDVVVRVLRAIGLTEELRTDRFSIELERLDLSATAIDPLDLSSATPQMPADVWPERCYVVGIGRHRALRVEPLQPAHTTWDGKTPESEIMAWPWLPSQGGPEVKIPGHVRFVEARRLWKEGDCILPTVIVGAEEAGDTRLLVYTPLADGRLLLRGEARCGGVSVDPIGYDCHVEENSSEPPTRRSEVESLVLRLPGTTERARPQVLVLDTHGGGLRLRSTLLPSDLIAVVSTTGGSLYLSSARIKLQRPGDKPLWAPSPAGVFCAALDEEATTIAVGTTTGQVQVLHLEADSLRLHAQYLLPKGISALCFVPAGVFGVPCLAIGTEDEQVHVIAIDFRHDGQEVTRLAAGGTPQRMICRPMAEGGFRLLILLSGGVLTSWEAHPNDDHVQSIQRLIDLGTKAAGSRVGLLRAALRGLGPHIRAVAMRELLRNAREGRIAGSIYTSSEPKVHSVTSVGRMPIPNKPTLERGTPAVASVLHLCRLMLQGDVEPGGELPPKPTGRSEVFDVAAWPLPRPPRHRLLVAQLFDSLVPIALGGTGSGADVQQSRLARELLGKLVQFCEDPLAVRGDLLQCIEAHVRPEHIDELSLWLPQLILYYDARLDTRPVPWPLTVDGVAALFLRHLQRLDRAQLFDDAEPTFFRNIVSVLEAVGPTLPSRFLLTNLALLLRSALRWERIFLAGDLGRVRLYLPHQVVEAMCQPEILPDPEVRAFLLGVSRRWGPRLPTIGSDENDEVSASISVGESLAWRFEVAVENGFDQMYYERLSDELTRSALPLSIDNIPTDAWALHEMVQGVMRIFDVTNMTELLASLQPQAVDRALSSLRSHHQLSSEHLSFRYRDEAWGLLDEVLFLTEQQFLLSALQDMDRKNNKAQLAHTLDEVAEQVEQHRNSIRMKLLQQLSEEPPAQHTGAFVSRMLRVRPQATVVALLTVWWQVLREEATRLRTEPDFDVRLVSDLGITEGRRMLRYAVLLAADAPRTAHGVLLTVRQVEPREVRARVLDPEAVDLEPGQELGLVIECPAAMAADGLRYRIEIELSHDGDKRTERTIEGQFRREARALARALFDSFSERLPTLFSVHKQDLLERIRPAQAAVALTTAFPAHAHELLAEAVGLDWPERPLDTLEDWRMVNVAVRTPSSGSQTASTQRQTTPTLREVVQQIGQRIGTLLGLPSADRLDTVDAVVRAVADAPVSGTGTASRGLILLGLPELAERARLEDSELRQLYMLGARIALAYRGRVLLLVSPQAAAILLQTLPYSSGPVGSAPELQQPRTVQLLDLDVVADPLSQQRTDERMRTELEQALLNLLLHRDGGSLSAQSGPGLPGLTAPSTAQSAVRTLIDTTGTDLRLCAECLPLLEQALRERSRAPLSPSAFEARVGTFLSTLWGALPLGHRLYLSALCSDSVDLDVVDLRAGMVVDQPVYSISGKDRLPTSKVVASAGVRIEQRTIDDLNRVMWLKKVRIRGSLHDSRSVLWTYLKQVRPRLRGRSPIEDPSGREQASGRWLEQMASDLTALGLISHHKLSGDRVFYAFCSPPAREWLRTLLGVVEGEAGLTNTIDGRNLTRGLPLWDAAGVDRALGGNAAQVRAVLGWNRPNIQGGQGRWQEFLDLSRSCRKWVDGQEEPRFVEAVARYFRLDLVDGTSRDGAVDTSAVSLRSVQIRFREKRQLPWLKRVVLYLPSSQPDRSTLEQVQLDLRKRLPMLSGGSGPNPMARSDASFAGIEATISDTSLSAIVIVPELSPEVLSWSRNLFHVAAIDITDIQHAALHDNPVEELIRRLAAAASYAALSPFRSKMGLANQELIEEMFYGRRSLLEEIRGQRQENFLVVGPRKIGKTSLLQRVRFELEQQGYRVIPRGMDYTTAPTSRELLKSMILELYEDLDPAKAQAGFALGEPLPPLRAVVELWTRKFPDRSVAIVLDEIDTILRTERRAYLLGEWREAATIGQALASLMPPGTPPILKLATTKLKESLSSLDLPHDVVDGLIEGLTTPPELRRQSPLLEELRSASALLLHGGSVCRVILAGHAELVEARWDLFGPLLNFAKLRLLGPLDESSAERMVREPFARLGLRFESHAVEQLLLDKTFRVPAWLQHCGALIIQSIDERLRSSRREEQKITDRDVLLALEKVYAEERAALQSENGMYMLGPECSFVLLSLVDEPWFTIDTAVDDVHLWFQTLEPRDRQRIAHHDEDFVSAFNHETVRRIVRDLTNTFYLVSDEAEYLTTEGYPPGSSSPGFSVPAALQSALAHSTATQTASATSPTPRLGDLGRDRLRRTYKVSRTMVSTVFHDELNLQRKIELARRALRLWQEGRGVWARTANRSVY